MKSLISFLFKEVTNISVRTELFPFTFEQFAHSPVVDFLLHFDNGFSNLENGSTSRTGFPMLDYGSTSRMGLATLKCEPVTLSGIALTSRS